MTYSQMSRQKGVIFSMFMSLKRLPQPCMGTDPALGQC